jgi:cytochrome c-type biogenesis protein CcmH
MRPILMSLALLAALATPAAAAVDPAEMLADPALEARAREIGKELRCLVCQNQSIDDSDADLARDLRQVVRERLLAGDSDAEVLRWIEDRYGAFVLLRPPVEPATWLLWFGPPALLVTAAIGIVLLRRRGAPARGPAELDPAERARLEQILDGPRT